MRTQLSVRAENFQPQRFAKIALAAALGFAITFTLSCSSGNIGDVGGGGVNGGSSNLSDLPKDAYLIEYDDDDKIVTKNKYDGNGEITLRIYDEYGEKYETKPAGKIQNGQVSLNLPDIESKYLENLNWEEVPDGVNFSFPENTAAIEVSLYVTTPDKSGCRMRLRGDNVKTDIMYFSKSGKVTGTERRCEDNGVCYDTNYDYNISKGWNVLYGYSYYDVNDVRHETTTTHLLKTGDILEWRIRCDDD
jgi:hypothetical protein